MFHTSKRVINLKPIPFDSIHTVQIMIVRIREGLEAKSCIFSVTESITGGYFL